MRNSAIILILLINISCIRSSKKEYKKDIYSIEKINQYFNIQVTSAKSAYVLIPLNGCSVCIEPAIQFAKQNINKKNIFFVISDFGIKSIEMEFRDQEIIAQNIFPDTHGFLYQLEIVFNNPVIFLIENGKLKKKIVLSAQNNVETFKQLTSFLQ